MGHLESLTNLLMIFEKQMQQIYCVFRMKNIQLALEEYDERRGLRSHLVYDGV
jgi:hypothetical protein